MRSAIVLGLCFWVSLTAFGRAGGNEVGNGGGGVACSASATAPATLRLLDYYVAEQTLGLTLDLGDASLTEAEKVELALNRLERLDPARTKRYRGEAASFFANTVFVDKALLPDTKDFGEVPRSACRSTASFPK
jgi:hypothetical protein